MCVQVVPNSLLTYLPRSVVLTPVPYSDGGLKGLGLMNSPARP